MNIFTALFERAPLICSFFGRPCPFLIKKKQICSSSVDANQQQLLEPLISTTACSGDPDSNQDSSDKPLRSGIRIRSDGKYEVYVDGKLFEDKSSRSASAASRNTDSKVQ